MNSTIQFFCKYNILAEKLNLEKLYSCIEKKHHIHNEIRTAIVFEFGKIIVVQEQANRKLLVKKFGTYFLYVQNIRSITISPFAL